MKHLLITGFDPFGGETVNPSWEAVCRLPDAVGGYRLTKLQIPTVFAAAADAVLAAAKADTPDVILCIGQSGGRSAVTPERIGVNIRDAKIARAQVILETTNIPIVEIADQLAFNTPNYFIKCFRETVGCTPSQYRKRLPGKR